MRGLVACALVALLAQRHTAAGDDPGVLGQRTNFKPLTGRGAPGSVENAVELGLDWLARHQHEDGRWDCDGFMRNDPGDDMCDGPGNEAYDVGVTALAVLAFLGAGYTDRGAPRENKHAGTVQRALGFLLASLDEHGVFGTRASRQWMYQHAIATLALVELFGMTHDEAHRAPAQRALDFLASARNPEAAWRYEPRGGENDASVTSWCTLALAVGRHVGLEVDDTAFEEILDWLDTVTDFDTGRVGYRTRGGPSARPESMQDRFPAGRTEAMTAAGILTRVLAGEDPRRSSTIRSGVTLCGARLPDWNPESGTIDFYYWHFGALALFQVGGRAWKVWSDAMLATILPHQHPRGSGTRRGSWDPIGVWCTAGGRVYSTALAVLTLESYYRYRRIFGGRPPGRN